ncbi:MAG: phosphoribosyltransferase [Gemmatimonadales bacterium]|nr:phosphoribosyltransferase [Gemmatimonadales bacterium]
MRDPSAPREPRDVLEIDWPLFGELCRGLALKIAREYDPELVLGIAKAGVVPGAVVASMLRRDFAAMSITRRTEAGRPTLIAGPPATVRGRRVLVVDETCDSGDTLKVALAAVRRLAPAEVRTAVSIRTGAYEPHFCALQTESLIILPWDREVVLDGELQTRPEYADWLRRAVPDDEES